VTLLFPPNVPQRGVDQVGDVVVFHIGDPVQRHSDDARHQTVLFIGIPAHRNMDAASSGCENPLERCRSLQYAFQTAATVFFDK